MTNGLKAILVVGILLLVSGPLGGHIYSHWAEVQAERETAALALEADAEVLASYILSALVATAIGYLVGLVGLVTILVAVVLYLRARKREKAPAARTPAV
ncbi:MAG: hypothetical protein WBD63_10485 [Phycisphaerae bacterium]|nr:hypothetical protein [Phycisphaerae bacterium]